MLAVRQQRTRPGNEQRENRVELAVGRGATSTGPKELGAVLRGPGVGVEARSGTAARAAKAPSECRRLLEGGSVLVDIVKR
jgi:hypothetical protein